MREILVFLGHDFFGDRKRKREYRKAVARACDFANQHAAIQKKGWKYSIVFGDTTANECSELFDKIGKRKKIALNNAYWNEIRAIIDACDFAILDLSHRDDSSDFLNHNVVLEYGVAIGYGIPTVPIGRNRKLFTDRLSNTAGQTYKSYTSISGSKNDSLQVALQEILLNILSHIDRVKR